MQPKDLKLPFSFESRRPLLQDSVFYVPDYYSNYSEFALPALGTILGNDNPVCIEYCSGNGDWILDRALNDSHTNWIAVEMRFDRIRKIWAKMKNYALENLLIVCGEALTFTHNYLSNHVLEEVFINFPDPWPKMRHEKNRLMKPRFLTELTRVLKSGKSVTFVTDDQNYLDETLSCFSHHALFSEPFFRAELPKYGSSWFEELWREKGKQIYYTQYTNESTS